MEYKTVSFNTNGGSYVPDQNLIKGWKITRPDDPRRGNKLGNDVFEGWYDETFEHEWDFDIIPTEDMVLYAKWTILPENRQEADRWSKFVDPDSTATLEYEFDSKTGVCKITVSGIAEANDEENNIYNNWKARANYLFTAQADTRYTFVVEAWKEEVADENGRWMGVQYYYDDDKAIYRDTGAWITNERKTYTLISEAGPIIKGGVRELRFQSAHILGTFYVKFISIAPSVEKTLVISGIPNYSDGMIGLFSAVTTLQEALETARNYNKDDNWGIIAAGSSLSEPSFNESSTTAYFPLNYLINEYYDNQNHFSTVRWTGGGSYRIGMLARINNEDRFFWLNKLVDFSNAVTTIQFNSDWEEIGLW
jgi:uncharacterized repeat protein (TIGR02543 family)